MSGNENSRALVRRWGRWFTPLAAALLVGGGCLTPGAVSVPGTEATQLGLVSVLTFTSGASDAVRCSGVLLTNNWVLTAGHCLDAETGKVTQVTMPGTPGIFTMNALYKFGAAGDPTGPDIGLIRLAQPMPISGFTNRFFTRLNRIDPVGKQVTVYGQSTGVYLKTNSTVERASGRNLELKADSSGSTTTSGDSGGPTFLNENGQTFLVGLTSVNGGTIAATHPAVDWLIAATRTFLDQTQPFDATIVLSREIEALPEGNRFGSATRQVGDDWPSVQRSVTWMCLKRGFIGGTLVPDATRENGVFKVVCIGRSGGKKLKATQAQIAATQSGFDDINAVGWAQASRAAAGVCATVPGSVGGFFEGFHLDTAEGRIQGLVCVNSSAGEFVEVDSAALPNVGQVDLNSTAWLAARSDASAYCRGFGYEGGIATGNQAPSKRGVLCIGRKALELGGFDTTPNPSAGQQRALYAVNIDEPLLAPPGAAIDVTLSFKNCHLLLANKFGCPVAAEFRQWVYDPATHRLQHAESGRCVNISGARTDVDAPIILFPCSGAANEKWTVISKAPDHDKWRIKSDLSGLCLTALPGHSGHTQDVVFVAESVGKLAQRPCDGSDSQLFDSVDADFLRRIAPH